MNQIQKINEKICLIQAEHDCKSSKSRSTEGARKLANKLYVSKRSRVMLLWNVNISLGLVNGSTGHVVGFIYREGHKAPDLPYSIIIHFDDYKGPPFFTIYGCKQYENISVDPLIKEWVLISPPDKREKWVPILVSEYKWGKSVNDENPNHSRKQFPICLAWALTVWKSQGMTIKGLVKFLLGDKEKEHGLTYVGFSRVLKHEQLDIGPGCSLERLTTKISNGYRLKRRLIEDIRLDVLYDTCRIFFSN
jgi:ATP-dependent exoDNAse (exonuclease V) alpha subunit